MLDGWGTHERSPVGGNRFDFQTMPAALRGDVLSRYGEDPLGIHEAPCDSLKPRNLKELIWFRDALIRGVETKARMAVDFLKQEPWAYFEANFFAAHCVGHQCWHYHDPEHPRYDADTTRAVGDPVRDVYVALDRGLGQVLNALDNGARVIVYCSHGMGPNYTATGGLLDKILLRLENIESPERAERAITIARNLWRSAPTPLRSLLVPLRARRFEASIQKRIQPAKSERKFFEQHVDGATGGIRINLEGRESHGKVKPGDEYEALCESLIRDLLEVVNADTGAPLVAQVFRSSQIYDGPFVERMPDLFIEWNRERLISRVLSPKIGTVIDPHPSHRSGDHRPQGWFAARMPGIPAGEVNGRVAVVDFAPTIAALLGVQEGDFDGTPIAALSPQTPLLLRP
jgi:predicted AlkP superfamily phosphohydrolase/phosphomutase